MKHFFLTFSFLVVSFTLYGQDNKLIYSKQVSNKADKTSEILKKSESYTFVDFVEIRLEKIFAYEQFLLQIEESSISISKERIDIRGINSYVFIGGSKDGARVLISVLNDDIQGTIETEKGVYAIETIDKNEYAIIKVDYTKLREACEDLHEIDGLSNIDNEENDNYEQKIEDRDTISPSLLKSVNMRGCKIRVLVLYTPNAQSSVSNIKNTILTAVALTNQSFINSQINYEIELAYAGLTNYTESGYSRDLDRYRINGDNYMDEVHPLRNKYSADICVLLTYEESGICGKASGIGVTAANAFCVICTYSTCATSNYSFGHEIGHLLGCRHDPFVDNNTEPFVYGHGYVSPLNTWRTIMAYSNACGGCPRKQYWSNPNITYGGLPMGTVDTHNNVRVWNERSNAVMAFRQPYNNLTITNTDIDFSKTQYADIIAKQDINTHGTVIVPNEKTLNLRAGNSITLQPGFSTNIGAEFSASIESVCDCGTSSSFSRKIETQKVTEIFDTDNNNDDEVCDYISSFSYSVYPNPSDEFINITYSLASNMFISIELVNLFGQKIKTVIPSEYQQVGTYTIQLSLSEFSSGTYFLIISSDNQTDTEKIIINK